jgi:ribonuclease P protein component
VTDSSDRGQDPETPSSPTDQKLRKEERLRNRQEYLSVQHSGRRYYGDHFILVWAPGPVPWPRLGVTVSRKVGRAVQRSRAKRLLREAFRKNKAILPSATDIVLIASPAILKASYRQVEETLQTWAHASACKRGKRPHG